VITVKASTRL